MRNIFYRKTHVLHSVTFFQKLCHVEDDVEKYGRRGQVTYHYGAFTLRAGFIRLQTHASNM